MLPDASVTYVPDRTGMESLIRKLVNGVAWLAALLLRKQRVEWRRVRDFDVLVVNTRPDISTADVLQRFEEALSLIADYQPARYAHLTRDVQAFFIKREAHRGHYQPRERVILTELTFLARRDISAAVVASSILHEGVHARIHSMAPNMSLRHPGREERICRKAELRFGEALPSPLREPVIERAQSILALEDDDLWVPANAEERRAAVQRVDSDLAFDAS